MDNKITLAVDQLNLGTTIERYLNESMRHGGLSSCYQEFQNGGRVSRDSLFATAYNKQHDVDPYYPGSRIMVALPSQFDDASTLYEYVSPLSNYYPKLPGLGEALSNWIPPMNEIDLINVDTDELELRIPTAHDAKHALIAGYILGRISEHIPKQENVQELKTKLKGKSFSQHNVVVYKLLDMIRTPDEIWNAVITYIVLGLDRGTIDVYYGSEIQMDIEWSPEHDMEIDWEYDR